MKNKKELICNVCENQIERCDSCGDNFSIGEEIKCTDKLGHEHECEACFNDSYNDAEVEEE